MTTHTLAVADRLSDQELVAKVKRLAHGEREATVELIIHLAVLLERRLYLSEGCGSLFTYCTRVLHLGEHATYNRIEAAQAARKFPIILDMLADGSVNLTTVRLLAPHLTLKNHVDLLLAAVHKSTWEVKQLVSTMRPLPPVAPSIRKLPAPRNETLPEPDQPVPVPFQAIGMATVLTDKSGSEMLELQAPVSSESPRHRGVISPLGPDRYRVQFTADAQMVANLRRVQDLLRHQIADGNLEKVMARAVTVLLEQLERQKTAATDRPVMKTKESEANSRHIPADVRRAVWRRDEGRCAFVGPNGLCGQCGFLEFHHVVPYSAGGQATVENIQLRCRAHNSYEVEQYFGKRGYGFVRETNDQSAYAQMPNNSFQNEFTTMGCVVSRALLRCNAPPEQPGGREG